MVHISDSAQANSAANSVLYERRHILVGVCARARVHVCVCVRVMLQTILQYAGRRLFHAQAYTHAHASIHARANTLKRPV